MAPPSRAQSWSTAAAGLDRLVTWSRVRAYAAILLAGYGFGWLVIGLTLRQRPRSRSAPPSADFIIFYGFSRLTLAGQAIAAYVLHARLMAPRSRGAGQPRGGSCGAIPPPSN